MNRLVIIFLLFFTFNQAQALAADHFASKEEKAALINNFEKAQKNFLLGKNQKALLHYQQITIQGLKSHWHGDYRSLIFDSFIKQAQISEATEQKIKFLKFALAYAPDLEPDKSIFPPPVTNQFAELKKTTPQILWRPSPYFLKYSEILINGLKHHVHPALKIKLHPGNIKITLISKTDDSDTYVIHTSQLTTWLPSDSLDLSLELEAPKTPSPLKSLHLQQEKPKTHSILKNKWIWIGAASAAAIFYSINQRQAPEKRKPTVKEGF